MSTSNSDACQFPGAKDDDGIGYEIKFKKFYYFINVAGIIVNLIFFVNSFWKIFFVKKGKMSSLETRLLTLCIVEILISVIWILNITNFFTLKDKSDDCEYCRTLALISIFLYVTDWMLLVFNLRQFKRILVNPLAAVFKPYVTLIKDISFSIGVGILMCFIEKYGDNYGTSPMLTCFIRISGKSNLYSIVTFSLFMILPFSMVIYGIIESISIFKHIKKQREKEMEKLFARYGIFLGTYIIFTSLLFIVFLWDFIVVFDDALTPAFRWTTFTVTIGWVCTPLIVAILRFLHFYIKSDFIVCVSCFDKDNNDNLKEQLMLFETGPRSENLKSSLEDIEKFENKAVKRFASDFYVSVCYCMEKIKELKNHDKMIKVSPLDNKPKTIEQCKESQEYIISKEKIMQLNSPLASDNIIYSLGKHQINCVEFAPSVFSYLRELDGVSEKEVIDSFLPSNNKQGIQESEARGGNFFISTDDKQFLLKTIPYQDAELIRLVLLWHLAEHFTENKNSLIGRIYGLYKIEKKSSCFSSEDIYFILMKNVYGAFDEIVQCKYDLKGSSLDRSVNIRSIDTLNKKVMKDNNFREIERALLLSKTNSEKLTTNCEKDVVLLANLGVMDYSLLVVKLTLNNSEMVALFGEDHFIKTQQEISKLLNKNIDNKEENNEKMLMKFEEIRFDLEKIENLRKYLFPSLIPHQAYIIAIIDFFQLYNLGKAIEQKFKGMIADIMAISSSPPDDYVVRFLKNLNEICNCKKLFENDENDENDKVFNGFVVVD